MNSVTNFLNDIEGGVFATEINNRLYNGTLPPEMLKCIFDYLCVSDLATLCHVHPNLNDQILCWYKQSWIDIALNGERLSQDQILRVLSCARPFLESLRLYYHSGNWTWIKMLTKLDNLKKVILKDDEISPHFLTKLTKLSPAVKTIHLISKSFNKSTFNAVAKWRKMENITLEMIKTNDHVMSDKLDFSQLTRKSKRLTHVSLVQGGFNISRRSLTSIGKFMSERLAVLEINCNGLDDSSFRVIGNLRLTRLKVCDLTTITGHGLEIIKNIRQLEELEICANSPMPNTAFLRVFSNALFEHLRKLKVISCPELEDTVVRKIVEKCADLTSLSIVHCPLVSDDGVGIILTQALRINELCLIGVNITTGVFITNKKKLKKLQFVRISNCSQINTVDDKILSALFSEYSVEYNLTKIINN